MTSDSNNFKDFPYAWCHVSHTLTGAFTNFRTCVRVSGHSLNFRTFQDKFQNFRNFRTTPRPEHLVLHCHAYDQAWQSCGPNSTTSDPRRPWSFLERIGVVTIPPTGNERQRESNTNRVCRQKGHTSSPGRGRP